MSAEKQISYQFEQPGTWNVLTGKKNIVRPYQQMKLQKIPAETEISVAVKILSAEAVPTGYHRKMIVCVISLNPNDFPINTRMHINAYN
jgi:hypothetical protein